MKSPATSSGPSSAPLSRRSFLSRSCAVAGGALASASWASAPSASAAGTSAVPVQNPFCTFTKVFQHLSYDEVADLIAEIGFDGIEAPVRPGGHVLPENVEEDLPKMAEAMKKRDLEILIMTSGINEVSDEQHTETVLRTAAALGIKRYRMAYFKYDLSKPIPAQLDEIRPKLKDLVALNKEIGIQAVYQNHSGNKYVGAPLWDLYELIKDHPTEYLASCYDIGHATVEGAKCWPINFALMRPHFGAVYIKEPQFLDNTVAWGPLGDGAVDKGFYKTLLASGYTGPISLHVEYLKEKDGDFHNRIVKATKKDFATLKQLLSEAAS